MEQSGRKSARIPLTQLVKDINEGLLIDDTLTEGSDLKRELAMGIDRLGGQFPEEARPGIFPAIRHAIETGKITVRASNGMPEYDALAVIPLGDGLRTVNDGSSLPDYKVSTLPLWHVSPEDADAMMRLCGLPERYTESGATSTVGADMEEAINQKPQSMETGTLTQGRAPGVSLPSRKNKLNGRVHALQHVIDEAKQKTSEPDNYQAVWATLVQMAGEAKPIPPVLGHVDDEGIKYRSSKNGKDGVDFFTKNALRCKMSRDRDPWPGDPGSQTRLGTTSSIAIARSVTSRPLSAMPVMSPFTI